MLKLVRYVACRVREGAVPTSHGHRAVSRVVVQQAHGRYQGILVGGPLRVVRWRGAASYTAITATMRGWRRNSRRSRCLQQRRRRHVMEAVRVKVRAPLLRRPRSRMRRSSLRLWQAGMRVVMRRLTIITRRSPSIHRRRLMSMRAFYNQRCEAGGRAGRRAARRVRAAVVQQGVVVVRRQLRRRRRLFSLNFRRSAYAPRLLSLRGKRPPSHTLHGIQISARRSRRDRNWLVGARLGLRHDLHACHERGARRRS